MGTGPSRALRLLLQATSNKDGKTLYTEMGIQTGANGEGNTYSEGKPKHTVFFRVLERKKAGKSQKGKGKAWFREVSCSSCGGKKKSSGKKKRRDNLGRSY